MAGWRDRTLLDLLTEHGLDLSPEHEFPNDGWSGATFTSLQDQTGRRFVLKRTSLAQDWIARATHDEDLREGWLAALPSTWLGGLWGRTLPYLGAASDGDGVAILMPDLSDELIAWERPGLRPGHRSRDAVPHPERGRPAAQLAVAGCPGDDGRTRGASSTAVVCAGGAPDAPHSQVG